MRINVRNLKKIGRSLRARSSTVTNPTGPCKLSSLSTPSTPRQPTEIPSSFARRGSPHRRPAPSHLVAAPSSRVEPRHVCHCAVIHPPPRLLRLVASCPVPAPARCARSLLRRGAADVGAATHKIRSSQTRSGLLQLHLALPSFLGCCKHVLQVYISSVSDVSYACYKCFMWILQK
jgi:hypothetical protein